MQADFQRRVALGLDADHVRLVGGGAGQHVHVYTAAQHAAVLVVGVVAAQLRAAGAAEQSRGHVPGGLELVQEGLHHMAGPLSGPVRTLRAAVQGVELGEAAVKGSGGQIFQKLLARMQFGYTLS